MFSSQLIFSWQIIWISGIKHRDIASLPCKCGISEKKNTTALLISKMLSLK